MLVVAEAEVDAPIVMVPYQTTQLCHLTISSNKETVQTLLAGDAGERTGERTGDEDVRILLGCESIIFHISNRKSRKTQVYTVPESNWQKQQVSHHEWEKTPWDASRPIAVDHGQRTSA